MSEGEDAIELGVVVKPHGLRGALKARLHNPESTALSREIGISLRAPDGRVYSDLRVLSDSGGPGMVLVEARGISDREAAEGLRGARLLVERAELPSPDEGEYFYVDLIGCSVAEGERSYGHVVEVFSAGASDVLVVRNETEERLIPLVDDWVAEVDVEGKRIEIVGGDQWDPAPLDQ